MDKSRKVHLSPLELSCLVPACFCFVGADLTSCAGTGDIHSPSKLTVQIIMPRKIHSLEQSTGQKISQWSHCSEVPPSHSLGEYPKTHIPLPYADCIAAVGGHGPVLPEQEGRQISSVGPPVGTCLSSPTCHGKVAPCRENLCGTLSFTPTCSKSSGIL